MDVVCRKYSCQYNDRAKCSRKHLNVDKKTNCADIKINHNKIVTDMSIDMFSHEPDISPYHHCRTMNIKCEAVECIYNKDKVCFSNGIFVGSKKTSAPCNSFVPR